MLGDYAKVVKYGAMDGSLRTDNHRAYCAFAFLEDHAPRERGMLNLAKLPAPSKAAARRKWIYDLLV